MQAAQRQPTTTPATSFPKLHVVPGFGGGPPTLRREPPVSNGTIAILVFIAFESMMFAGLVSAYYVLRSSNLSWPPPGMPRLPLAVTAINTAILLFSVVSMWRAVVSVRRGDLVNLRSALLITGAAGVTFLTVQGSEWVQLIHQGMTLSSGSYGSIFYTLIGLHAVHVLGAVGWLVAVVLLARRGVYSAENFEGVKLCAMYWYFVCGLWVVLFGTVYLS